MTGVKGIQMERKLLNSFADAIGGKWIEEIEGRPFQVIVDHLSEIVEIGARWGTYDSDVILERFNGFLVEIIFERTAQILARIVGVVTIHINAQDEIFSY